MLKITICFTIGPPKVTDNKELSIWLCETHNIVNKRLNKPIFNCDFENLKKRWKTGYDHCKGIYEMWKKNDGLSITNW